MNRDDIIRMARDSGMELYGLGKDREKFVYYLQEFATLVAAAEREACEILEYELAKSPAHFATMAEWKAYKEGVTKYVAAIRARGQA